MWTAAPGWVVSHPGTAARLGPAPCVLCPIMSGLGPELADIAAALPIGDANAQLMQALETLCPAPGLEPATGSNGRDHVIAGVFGNDPFRPRDDVLAAIAASPISAVANWPSVGMLSGELAEQLSSAGFVFEKEIALLAAARAAGLAVVVFVCSESQANAASALDAAMIVVAPPPVIDRDAGREEAVKALRQTLGALQKRSSSVELRLYSHAAHAEGLADASRDVDGVIGFSAD